jgi:O-antigen ligase
MIAKRLGPVYLLLIGLLLFATRDFEAVTRGPIDLSNLHKVFANVMAALWLGIFFLMRGLPKRWTPTHRLYFVFLLSGYLSSILYSANLGYSSWKLFEVSLAFAASLYVLRGAEQDPHLAYRFYCLLLSFFRFLLLATIIGVFLFPDEAMRSPISDESITEYGAPILPYQVYGAIIIINPNTLGAIAAILSLVHFARLMQRQFGVRNWVWLFIGITFLIFSQSRTAWVGASIAILVVFYQSQRVPRKFKVALTLIVSTVLFIFAGSVALYFTRGVDPERLAGLSGRAAWWAAALQEYMAAGPFQKVFGLGYMTANRQILADEFDAGGAASLHSDYIDALISCGFLGASVLFVAFLSLLGRAILVARAHKDSLGTELVAIVIICFIRSFSGTTVAVYNLFLVLFFAIAILVSSREVRGRT